MSRLSDLLGIEWNEDAQAAANKLGVHCETWETWAGGQGFETCADYQKHISVFGMEGHARLVRKDAELQGIEITFGECADAWPDLREQVRDWFSLEDPGEGDLYEIGRDGALVRLTHDSGGHSCTLVLTAPQFGKAYSAHLLSKSMGNLSAGLRP